MWMADMGLLIEGSLQPPLILLWRQKLCCHYIKLEGKKQEQWCGDWDLVTGTSLQQAIGMCLNTSIQWFVHYFSNGPDNRIVLSNHALGGVAWEGFDKMASIGCFNLSHSEILLDWEESLRLGLPSQFCLLVGESDRTTLHSFRSLQYIMQVGIVLVLL